MTDTLKTVIAILVLAAFSVVMGTHTGNVLALLHVAVFATGTVGNLAFVYGLLSALAIFGGCLKAIYDAYE